MDGETMLTAQDYKALATHLIQEHGTTALTYANRAVAEMEDQGEEERAQAWRLLRAFVIDLLEGRLESETQITLH